MKSPRSCLAALFAFSSAIFYPPAIRSQEPSESFAPRLWINPGVYSYHFNRGKNLREDNVGFGAELMLAEDHGLMAGSFINSNRARSRYAAYQWRPLHWHFRHANISTGLTIGGFDGYPQYKNGAWFAAALPVLAVEGKRIGVNLYLVPTISDRTDGAISLQIKLKLW